MPYIVGVNVDDMTINVLKTGFKIGFFFSSNSYLSGTKVFIGDNLAHFSANVIQLAQQYEVKSICLTNHTTHVMQPVDAAFFGPIKRLWRSILEAWKRSNSAQSRALSKNAFLELLRRFHQQLQTETGRNTYLISSLRSTAAPF